MIVPLFVSLFFSLVQRRSKYKTYPLIEKFEQYMKARENDFETPAQRYTYYVHTLSAIQKSYRNENEKKLKWLERSMRSFWISLGTIFFSYLACIVFWLGELNYE